MKVNAEICLLSLVVSITRSCDVSSFNKSDHIIDIDGNTTRVIKIGTSDHLDLMFRTPYVIICPQAFEGSGVRTFRLSFNTSNDGPNEANNYGRILLTAESLVGLNLESLSLKNTDLTLNREGLVPVSSLNHLSLKSCNIVEVPTILLMSFPKLESLILSHNNMTLVHHNGFQSLQHLWYLDLSSNNITTFESGCFNGLEELERLDLSGNSFILLPDVFEGLPKLAELHIRNCPHLKELHVNTFRATPTLTALTISGTGVHALQPGLFDGLMRLQWLLLADNQINRIPKNLFNKLESLEYLFLDNNRIMRMESHAFERLRLRYLGLSYQNPMDSDTVHVQRQVIENKTFNDLTADVIYMVGTSNPNIKPGAFDGLTAGLVDLHCADLGNIETDVFVGLNTRKLDLRMNRISHIVANAFKQAVVEELDLSFNLVKTTDYTSWGVSETALVII